MTGLAKLEEYKAPWEVDSTGAAIPEDDQKVDPARLKKYLHGLLSDKVRLQDSVTTVTGERDALKTAADAEARKGETDDAKQTREREDAIKAAEAKGDLKALALDVALDIDGITAKQAKTLAKRLVGKDRAELEADAKAVAQEFGYGQKADAEEGDEDEDGVQTPASRPRRPAAQGDPNPSSPSLPDASDNDVIGKLFPRR